MVISIRLLRVKGFGSSLHYSIFFFLILPAYALVRCLGEEEESLESRRNADEKRGNQSEARSIIKGFFLLPF